MPFLANGTHGHVLKRNTNNYPTPTTLKPYSPATSSSLSRWEGILALPCAKLGPLGPTVCDGCMSTPFQLAQHVLLLDREEEPRK